MKLRAWVLLCGLVAAGCAQTEKEPGPVSPVNESGRYQFHDVRVRSFVATGIIDTQTGRVWLFSAADPAGDGSVVSDAKFTEIRVLPSPTEAKAP